MKTFYLNLIVICLVLISCSEEDGKARDSIKLSESHIEFGYEPNRKLVTTKNANWGIIGIKEDGVEILFHRDGPNPSDREFEYEGSWYHIKRDYENITISVLENSTNTERQLRIDLQAGNWFGSSITIEQKGRN